MTAKIVEVIAKILEGINLKQSSMDEINQGLINENIYDKQLVSAAFSLVYDKVLVKNFSEKMSENLPHKNFRIFTEEEVLFIGKKNRDYLMYLMNVGLITPTDLDLILEQLLMSPVEEITKEDINWLVFISVVDFSTEILPGSRILLHSEDSIN